MIKTNKLRFEGALIERGFWVYACRVKHKGKYLIYIGRTGDSSSPNAASPFSRLGRHLDLSPNAAANMLLRHLRTHHFNPRACSYFLVAVGPLYREQRTPQAHRRIRDRVALIEAKLAQVLRNDGYEVVGKHPFQKGKVELDSRFESILRRIRAALKDRRR